MKSVKLIDFYAVSFLEFEHFRRKLTTGVYHLVDFYVLVDPKNMRRTAYLKCLEGDFYTLSTPIIHELLSDIGKMIRAALNQTDVSDVEVEIISNTNRFGKLWGLTFRIAEKTKERYREPIEVPQEIPVTIDDEHKSESAKLLSVRLINQ